MAISSATVVARNEAIVFTEIDDIVVMMDVDEGRYYELDEIGTRGSGPLLESERQRRRDLRCVAEGLRGCSRSLSVGTCWSFVAEAHRLRSGPAFSGRRRSASGGVRVTHPVHHYRAYGLRVRSEIAVPFAVSDAAKPPNSRI